MGVLVASGASIMCTFGAGAGQLTCAGGSVMASGKPAATIKDSAPMMNIGTCGMCTSMSNPAVASATAAALGVLTPQPCVPAPAGVWMGGGKVLIGGVPCLTESSQIMCSYAGTIKIIAPGQTNVLVS